MWNGPIFVEGLDTFRIFVQGIIDLYGNGPKGEKKFLDRSRISQRASKGKQTIAQGIFTPFGVQCKVFLQGFAQRARKKEPRVFLHPLVFSERYFFPFKVQPRVHLEGI